MIDVFVNAASSVADESFPGEASRSSAAYRTASVRADTSATEVRPARRGLRRGLHEIHESFIGAIGSALNAGVKSVKLLHGDLASKNRTTTGRRQDGVRLRSVSILSELSVSSF